MFKDAPGVTIIPNRAELKVGEEMNVKIESANRTNCELTVYSGASELRNILARILQTDQGKKSVDF